MNEDIIRQLRVTADTEDAWSEIAPVGGLLREAADALELLQAWKLEAIEVLGEWEKVWEAAGRPGPYGHSKAANVEAWIEEHR